MITLYDYELSGNCYKLRLLLSFLQIEYTHSRRILIPPESTSRSGF